MDDQRINSGGANRRGQRIEHHLLILIVDADAAFHRHGDGDRRRHGGDATAHQRRLAHQAGAESAALDAIGGAATV